jgi:hypothetical protein
MLSEGGFTKLSPHVKKIEVTHTESDLLARVSKAVRTIKDWGEGWKGQEFAGEVKFYGNSSNESANLTLATFTAPFCRTVKNC